jgi:hypothetical protein
VRQAERLGTVAGHKGTCQRSCRRQTRAHHGKRHQEGQKRFGPGPVDVDGSARSFRKLGYEFGVPECRKHGERQRQQECNPKRPAYSSGDLTNQRIDAGPEYIADDKHEQHGSGNCAPEGHGLRRRLVNPAHRQGGGLLLTRLTPGAEEILATPWMVPLRNVGCHSGWAH